MESIRHRGLIQPLKPFSAGFTLIELLVVIAIITIISAVMITNQGSFNKTLILSNTAYDIALTMRSAETYGLGSRASGISTNVGYGLHFQVSPSGSFSFFADSSPLPGDSDFCHPLPAGGATAPDAKPGNCVYDLGEWKTDYAFGNGITIKDFCAYSGSWSCANTNGSTLTSLDVVFLRPNPNPFISTNGSYSSAITKACVAITSQQGGEKDVSVSASGQIIANAASCP